MKINLYKRKINVEKKNTFFIFFLVGFASFLFFILLVSSITDWKFSRIIAGDNYTNCIASFGTYFVFIPSLFFSILTTFVCVTLILSIPHHFLKRRNKRLYYVFSYTVCILTTWYVVYLKFVIEQAHISFNNVYNFDFLDLFEAFVADITITFFISLVLLSSGLKNKINTSLFKWSLYAILFIATALFFCYCCKNNVSRQSYLSIIQVDGDKTRFKEWYSLLWDSSIDINANENSFCSIYILTIISFLVVLPLISNVFFLKTRKFYISLIIIMSFLILTIFAELNAGISYLSDVMFGAFFYVVINLFYFVLIFRLNTEKKFEINYKKTICI
ncbi:MAG: hypothetical protein LBD05_00355 [Mycoplasmataceae bacterium]|jgi:hypothetical protein|nr:hypothetical protein [Mycoplasmataceae bacterium]